MLGRLECDMGPRERYRPCGKGIAMPGVVFLILLVLGAFVLFTDTNSIRYRPWEALVKEVLARWPPL